jgi:hypothetical protein
MATADKLPAPTNVTATVQVDQLLVTWDAVAGAKTYQVNYVGASGAEEELEDTSEFVDEPRAVLGIADYVAMMLQVRGIEGHEGGPEQAGQKGAWSPPLMVTIA